MQSSRGIQTGLQKPTTPAGNNRKTGSKPQPLRPHLYGKALAQAVSQATADGGAFPFYLFSISCGFGEARNQNGAPVVDAPAFEGHEGGKIEWGSPSKAGE
jgi:hypothetical protein